MLCVQRGSGDGGRVKAQREVARGQSPGGSLMALCRPGSEARGSVGGRGGGKPEHRCGGSQESQGAGVRRTFLAGAEQMRVQAIVPRLHAEDRPRGASGQRLGRGGGSGCSNRGGDRKSVV